MEEQVKASPNDGQLQVLLGTALAYAGRDREAIDHGKRGVALVPLERSSTLGSYALHQLARIYIVTGDQEKAIDLLEQLLKIPYDLTPAWLRIDPTFDPLRKDPRFQKLVEPAA
jgi:tetratricopeptide (TPR) repeat protein